MGKTRNFIGLDFSYGKDYIAITQTPFIEQLLKKANMENANGTFTPCTTTYTPDKEDDNPLLGPEQKREFMELLGSIHWLALSTRPDVTYIANVLSRVMAAPRMRDAAALKRVIRYLSKTKTRPYVIKKPKHKKSNFSLFADSSFGDCMLSRRSTGGYCIFYDSTLVAWRTKRQDTLSHSSSEAEIKAAALVCRDYLPLRMVAKRLGMLPKIEEDQVTLRTRSKYSAAELFQDNTSSIAFIQERAKRMKHLQIRYLFIQELRTRGVLKVSFTPTKRMLADLLTKSLAKPRFDFLWNCIQSFEQA